MRCYLVDMTLNGPKINATLTFEGKSWSPQLQVRSLLVSNLSYLVLFAGRVEFVADEVPLAEEFCNETERER